MKFGCISLLSIFADPKSLSESHIMLLLVKKDRILKTLRFLLLIRRVPGNHQHLQMKNWTDLLLQTLPNSSHILFNSPFQNLNNNQPNQITLC